MTKEIIVNAGELESRVAIMENGRLMELHVEREPKIVGNIYKGRVTKVLKGMDAAFVDIGIERNAFLAASDVIPEGGDDESGNGHNHGRIARPTTSITQLLRNNQEILVQVVRAPMGTKGARITTRLSLPGRYMVLMLNSGTYVGVSRKIEDSKERQRLRTIANEIRPENYSLIVRTEAEGKSEEELRQDLLFLVDMARRIEDKASSSPAPSLVHGDLSLIFRLIRDAFTRDVNRLVVDNPTTYDNVLELVGLIAPRMKNRVFLYDEEMPIFHAYNVETEIERTLRRKVWLPSGGTLIIDQAEALTAIDVNTGRFVGSVELAETVLTTNLQAADEVARQLRLRDLGGIIVVDFIDMDNPKHRQQVMTAFEEALRRDRAKIKVHSISPLGLVEMTRKRTGDSLVRLLTEPCPYCSGIGRVQNAITMALRIERELAATSVTHPEVEAYQLTAHPRVIASMLGYEGEAHRDLEIYLDHPVYLRVQDEFHPNAYRLDKFTLEQALAAVKHLEEDDIVEGQVVNPDPEVSLAPLVIANGMYIIVPDLDAPVGALVKIRIKETGTSLAVAEPLAAEQRGIRSTAAPIAIQRPSLVPELVLPGYLREEQAATPPTGLQLLSPTAEAVPIPASTSSSAATARGAGW
ncbi:MAG TPA: Rne/Rng family ribonuclease [Armatimonadota bacterium]|nr:Rne/Rng family ribonuclease [Armatimonadota bacterium]